MLRSGLYETIKPMKIFWAFFVMELMLVFHFRSPVTVVPKNLKNYTGVTVLLLRGATPEVLCHLHVLSVFSPKLLWLLQRTSCSKIVEYRQMHTDIWGFMWTEGHAAALRCPNHMLSCCSNCALSPIIYSSGLFTATSEHTQALIRLSEVRGNLNYTLLYLNFLLASLMCIIRCPKSFGTGLSVAHNQ